ncbi:MAG: glycosyltransferase 87 family protein [Anaerolineae bacterium]
MFLAFLGAIYVSLWLILYRWFDVFSHIDIPHFALDKLPGGHQAPLLRATLLVFVLIVIVYALGLVLLARTHRQNKPVWLGAAGVALLAGVVNLGIYPVGALDVFNYILNTKLTYFYEQNPYLVTFAQFAGDSFAQYGFSLHAPLGYGPAWVLYAAVPAWLGGHENVLHALLAVKGYNLALLIVAALLIVKDLQIRKSERPWLAFYALLANPLVLFEGVANAHNDVLVATLLVAGVFALRRSSWLALPLVMLATMVKFFIAPALAMVLLAMLVQRWRPGKIALSVLAAAAVAVAVVLPFWADGRLPAGVVRGVLAYGNMNTSSIFSLAREFLRTRRVASQRDIMVVWMALSALFAVICLYLAILLGKRRSVEDTIIDALLLVFVLLSSLFPWYVIPVFALIAWRGTASLWAFSIVYALLGLAYYPASIWAWAQQAWTQPRIHMFQALLLAAPILAFVLGRMVYVAYRANYSFTSDETQEQTARRQPHLAPRNSR